MTLLPGDCFCLNGRLLDGTPAALPLTGSYLYQHLHALDRRPLHAAAHLERLLGGARELYGAAPDIDAHTLIGWSEALLRRNRFPAGSCRVTALLLPRDQEPGAPPDLLLLCGEILLDRGYALRSLRPRAVVEEYELPYPEHPTSLLRCAAALADGRARRRGAHTALRCDGGGQVLAAGEAPLFAVRGRRVYTPPPDRTFPSVERTLALRAIEAAGLETVAAGIPYADLEGFDELFAFDYRGITSLSECEGQPYMDVIASRIAAHLEVLLP